MYQVLAFISVALFVGVLWLGLRSKATLANRRNVALSALFLSVVLPMLLNPFPIFNSSTPIGALNAVISWSCLAIAIHEMVYFFKEIRIQIFHWNVFLAFLLYWTYSILLNVFSAVPTRPYVALFPVMFFLFVLLSPSRDEMLSILQYIFSLAILVNLAYLFIGIEAQRETYATVTNLYLNYKPNWETLDAGYRNPLWSVFGLSHRFMGSFTHPNSAGFFFALVVVCSPFLPNKRLRIFNFCSAGIMLALSASRTSAIGACLALGYILSHYYSQTKKIQDTTRSNMSRHFFQAILVFGATCGLVYTYLQNRSLNGRTGRISESLAFWQQGSKLTGLGKSVTYDGYLRVENLYLNALVFQGIFGLVALLGVVYMWFRALRQRQSQHFKLAPALFILFQTLSITETQFGWSQFNTGALTMTISLMVLEPIPLAALALGTSATRQPV